MSLITLIIVIVVVGVLLWLVETYIPMNPTLKKILYFVVILVLCLWLLQAFGVIGAVNSVRIR